LLVGWLKVFGFSLLASRSLNMVLQAALVWICLSWAQKRLKFEPWQLVLLVLLLAWPNSAAFMSRSGRYDMLACLLSTLLVLCLVEGRAVRTAVVTTGFVMPWVCLPALAFTAFASLLVGSTGVRWVRLALHLGSATAGFLALFFFADGKVGGDRFLSILHSLWLAPSDAAPHKGILILDNLVGLGADRFWLVMVPLVAAYLVWHRKNFGLWEKMAPSLRSWLGSGLLAVTACVLLYKMNILYWWVIGVPLAIAFVSIWRDGMPGYRMSFAILLVAMFVFGLPLRLWVGASQADRRQENSRLIRETLAAAQPTGDPPVVFVNWPFYYEAKQHGCIVIGPKFLGGGVGSRLQPSLLLLSRDAEAPAAFAHSRILAESVRPSGESSFLARFAAGPINQVPALQIRQP